MYSFPSSRLNKKGGCHDLAMKTIIIKIMVMMMMMMLFMYDIDQAYNDGDKDVVGRVKDDDDTEHDSGDNESEHMITVTTISEANTY